MKKNQDKKNPVLPLTAVICVLSLMMMVFVLTTEREPDRLEFTPPPFDAEAAAGTPQVPAELGWSELDAQAFRFSVCGKVMIKAGKADIWLTNPESNTVWLKARILDENGATLGETGLIRPGEYVQTVTFDTVPADGAAVGIKLMAYQPETYFSEGSATLNTTVKVEE